MKKYALLIGLVCCLASCNADDLNGDVQELNLKNEVDLTSDPKDTNWDKWKNNDDDSSDNDGN